MGTTPLYVSTINVSGATVVSGDTSTSAPLSGATFFVAGTLGSRVDNIDIVALGNVVSGTTARLFIVSGSIYNYFQSVPVQPVSPTGSGDAPWQAHLSSQINAGLLPINLASGMSLYGTLNNTVSGGIRFIGRGGNF